jgi:predicted nuclease of restriction endonuclease-like (RecB) superfamily
MQFNHLLNSIETTHIHFQEVAAKAINRSLTIRNWMIGCYIVEYEQNGVDRAKYGTQLLVHISKGLPDLKLAATTLKLCRRFYQCYPQIGQVVSNELKNNAIQIGRSLTDQFQSINNQLDTVYSSPIDQIKTDRVSGKKIVNNLSFTHIACLLTVEDALRRTFYEVECIKGNWSVRELKRQVHTGYFERMGFTNNPQKLSRLVQQSVESPIMPADLIKNLYAFEFLDLPQKAIEKESKVEQKLLDHLEEFLLEMGHGFCL